MLKIKNLSAKTIGKDGKNILENVDFSVGEKEIHCLLGKNGSGKTTLAYAIMGIARDLKIEGKINFLGDDISEKKVFQRAKLGITMAFQEPARFEGLTVKDFIFAGVNNGKTSGKEVLKFMEIVGISEDFLERKIDGSLSGGERKRIELVSVMAMKPKLMILDEPDASLDIIVYNELYDILLKIRNELGCSILLITHREEAGIIADWASFICEGKIVKTGRFRQVMRSYCEMSGRKERCRMGMRYKAQINPKF